MALEIERRFLVRGSGWRHHVLWEADLEQAYLASGPGGLVLRVRLRRGAVPDTGAWLTVKAPAAAGTAPHTRLEFEYPIPLPDAETMLSLSAQRIRKRRYGLDLAPGHWVLDVFADANAPLVLAEVELAAADQSVPVPQWCRREISERRDLSNAALALRPLQSWSAAERQAVLGEGLDGTEEV